MMDAKKKSVSQKKSELPRNLGDVVKELVEKRNEVDKVLNDIRTRLVRGMEQRFHDRGGCTNCDGRGWVVTWDTLDFMDGSAAEYGKCPEPGCTPETRKASGLRPNDLHHDKWRGVSSVLTRVDEDPAYKMLAGDLIQVVNDLELQIRETEYKRKAPFKKGEQVLVTRGRKVPVGTIAYVAYVNNGGLLLKTKENVDVRMSPAIGWVDAVYCERLVLHAHEEDVRCHGE